MNLYGDSSAEPTAITAQMLRSAVASAEAADQRARVERAARVSALSAMDIDMDALTPHEKRLLAFAYEGHIFHPRDYADLKAAVERDAPRPLSP